MILLFASAQTANMPHGKYYLKPWQLKKTFMILRSSLLLKLNTLLPQDDLPEPLDFAIHTGQPLPKAKIRPFSLKALLTVFKLDLQDADRS